MSDACGIKLDPISPKVRCCEITQYYVYPFLSTISKTVRQTDREVVCDMKCVLHFSLQPWSGVLFTVMYGEQVALLKLHA